MTHVISGGGGHDTATKIYQKQLKHAEAGEGMEEKTKQYSKMLYFYVHHRI